MENERQSTEPATAGALWAAGSRSDALPTPVAGGLGTNRFLSLARGSDDEQLMEPRSTVVNHTCSDTESVPEIANRTRRLRLRWNSDIVQFWPIVKPVDLPDSHDQRAARVRHAMQQERRLDAHQRQVRDAEDFIHSVVSRVGPLNSEDEIPRVLRRQQWSALNGPLMWATGDGDGQCAVLKWLASRTEVLRPVNVGGGEVPGRVAVAVGWEVLNFAMRSWGLQSKEDLSEWIHNQGFPVLGGEHISVAGCRSESGTP